MIKEIGTIILGNKVRVSDPCYDLNTWCAGTLENVKPGKYICEVELSDEGAWGTRVKSLTIRHENRPNGIVLIPAQFEVGVDSGQAGIFDYDEFAEHEKERDTSAFLNGTAGWYDKCCDLTLHTDNQAGIINGKGVVSNSGYGDGGYDCHYNVDENEQIDCIKITYISDEDEEDYDDEDYSDEEEDEE